MEQQNQVQGVEALQNSIAASQNTVDAPALEWHEEVMDYTFKDGAYTCEYLEGSFMSIDSLRKAWREKLSKEKLEQAQKELQHARRPDVKMTPAEKTRAVNKALKDKKKWATP